MQVVEFNPKVQQDVVELLEQLLQDAKDGLLKAAAIAAVRYDDKSYFAVTSGALQDQSTEILGSLAKIQAHIINVCMSSVEVDVYGDCD